MQKCLEPLLASSLHFIKPHTEFLELHYFCFRSPKSFGELLSRGNLTALLAISHRRVVLFPVLVDGVYSPGL